MRIKKKFLQSLIGVSVLALALKVLAVRRTKLPSLLRNANPAPRRASGNIAYEEIDAFIETQLKNLHVPGAALAVVEGDQIVHTRNFGRARPGGEAPSPQTPFVLGSTTKSFTALAIMQLVEAGRVELDAPVQRYLPWFHVADPHASIQMTVRHLLNQTSGLPTSAGWIPLADFDESSFAAERQARALSTLKLTRPVGSTHEYSNMNYNLLGLIIEAASAKSYESYVENHIFIPLEMIHSYTKKAAAKQNGLAMGHRFWFSRPIPTADLPLPRGSQASGQLISCAEDMAHYLISHLNGGRYGDVQILSPAGITEMHRPAAPVSFMGASLGHYGMGWYCEEHNQTKILWHSGIVPDFASYMTLIPEQKKGLVLLINADHFMMNPVITEIGSGLASLLAEKQPAPLKFGFLFLSMPALLLIPLLQVVGVIATLRQLRRWRQDPNSRPSRERLWGQNILLPLIPNLAFVAIPLWMLASRMLGFMLLFLQDFTWITLICGGFAGMWAFLRTGLILRSIRKSQTPISIR